MERKLPQLVVNRWNYLFRILNTVRINKEHLIVFFESIVDQAHEWDSENRVLLKES